MKQAMSYLTIVTQQEWRKAYSLALLTHRFPINPFHHMC